MATRRRCFVPSFEALERLIALCDPTMDPGCTCDPTDPMCMGGGDPPAPADSIVVSIMHPDFQLDPDGMPYAAVGQFIDIDVGVNPEGDGAGIRIKKITLATTGALSSEMNYTLGIPATTYNW